MRRFLMTVLLAMSGWAGAVFADDMGHPEGMHVHDAYARVTGTAGGSGAVFFMLHNNTGTDDTLISVTTDAAAKAELHTTSEDANGVMSMDALPDGLALPQGDMVQLQRGGMHIMLMGLVRPLADGDAIKLTLTFAKAPPMVIDVPVDNARKPGKGMDHGAMDHDGMSMSHDGMTHDAPSN